MGLRLRPLACRGCVFLKAFPVWPSPEVLKAQRAPAFHTVKVLSRLSSRPSRCQRPGILLAREYYTERTTYGGGRRRQRPRRRPLDALAVHCRPRAAGCRLCAFPAELHDLIQTDSGARLHKPPSCKTPETRPNSGEAKNEPGIAGMTGQRNEDRGWDSLGRYCAVIT